MPVAYVGALLQRVLSSTRPPDRLTAVPATSPDLDVQADGQGDWRGRCRRCSASGDPVEEAAAWSWTSAHVCGSAGG